VRIDTHVHVTPPSYLEALEQVFGGRLGDRAVD